MTDNIIKIVKYLFDPHILIFIAIVIFILGRICFHKDYLNCGEIIKGHLACFEGRNGKKSLVSIFLYFGVPALIALSLVQIRVLDDDVLNLLTIIVSILTSMFFTLLTLILDMRKRVRSDINYKAGDAAISSKLLKETYFSIMFEILVCILILILCFIELFAQEYATFSSFIIYYLTFVLLINLFMILKRVYVVIKTDLNIYK